MSYLPETRTKNSSLTNKELDEIDAFEFETSRTELGIFTMLNVPNELKIRYLVNDDFEKDCLCPYCKKNNGYRQIRRISNILGIWDDAGYFKIGHSNPSEIDLCKEILGKSIPLIISSFDNEITCFTENCRGNDSFGYIEDNQLEIDRALEDVKKMYQQQADCLIPIEQD